MNGTIATIPPVVWRIGQLVFTAILLALLWAAADGPEIMRSLRNAELWLLIAGIGALLCQTVLSAWRWKITAAELGQQLSLPHGVREYFMSQVVNQALPGGVMGDAARAVRARSEVGIATSGLAVGLERLAGQIAMFATLACAFTLTYTIAGGLDWPTQYAASIGITIALVIMALALCTVFWGRIGSRIRWIELAGKALFSLHVLPAQIILGVAITICNLAAFGLCAQAVGVSLSFGALFAIVPLILFSMLIPLTISGWGIREGSAALLLPIAGIAVADAVAASVMFGIAMLCATIPGLIIMVYK